jgi:putative cardiolipin synthase
VFGLHAKTFVFDRRTVYVGSLNLNLRSRFLNAESGMVIESSALAARVAADIEQNLRPENSWQLELEKGNGLRWLQRAADGRVEQRFDHDPQTAWSRRAQAALIAALPLEKYL